MIQFRIILTVEVLKLRQLRVSQHFSVGDITWLNGLPTPESHVLGARVWSLKESEWETR